MSVDVPGVKSSMVDLDFSWMDLRYVAIAGFRLLKLFGRNV